MRGSLHVDHADHTRLAVLSLRAVEPDDIRVLDVDGEGINLDLERKERNQLPDRTQRNNRAG